MKDHIITKHIEKSDVAVWFSATNRYLVVKDVIADILVAFENGIPHQKIAQELSNHFKESIENITHFINDTYHEMYLKNMKHDTTELEKNTTLNINDFEFIKYYQIGNYIFKIDYLSDFEVFLIHPKFSHLEIDPLDCYDHHYQIFTKNGYTSLIVNNNLVDSWHKKNIHYFQGKLSMYIVQHIHKKEEDKWLGVFHASGVSYNNKSLLLLGDSGNGKSTSLALLQAHGLTCLADDFVPVDVNQQHIYTFPSAISIKKNSLETLLPLYPELKKSAEFHFTTLNKIVRFLPPNIKNYNKNLPCKDIVFIKYKKGSEIEFNPISKTKAFEQLIPDSWISNKPENVRVFLNWFDSLNCYQLTYSNNDKMISTIKNLLSNDT